MGTDGPVRVAGGLVYRFRQGNPEVIVIDDVYGRVALPKGHVEGDELLEETALREVEEETGIVGRIVSPLAKVPYSFDQAGQTIRKDAFYFLIEAVGGELRPQREEIASVRFLPVEAAEMLQLSQGYPNNRDIFARGFAALRRAGAYVGSMGLLIDHTLLSPVATPHEIDRLCREARAYRFAAVCVHPLYVAQCAAALAGSPVKVCTVVGFPLGAATTATKVAQAREAVAAGAEEIDMVISLGAVKAGDSAYLEADIEAVVDAVDGDAIVKAILETAVLTPEEQVFAAQAAMRAGAHFVKTSTGFSPQGGATPEAVRRLRETVGDALGVKASGGIRTPDDARAMLEAGASRLGASAGQRLTVIEEAEVW